VQVGQPLASLATPLGHIGSQPSAGHGVGPGIGGGGMQSGLPPAQSHEQGGQFIVAGSQPGQAQAQPLPLLPPPGGGVDDCDWQTPEVHG
jgi:hypothetical protein